MTDKEKSEWPNAQTTSLGLFRPDGNVTFYKGAYNLNVEIISFDDKKIVYEVQHVPLHTYDQHARARVGVKFIDFQLNTDAVYSLYTEVFDKIDKMSFDERSKIFETFIKLEKARDASDNKDDYNLMSRDCSYKVEQDYSSLKGQMARRLKLCEEEQIVALHWILRDKMIKAGIDIAKSFAPGCDVTGECDYIAVSDHLSNAFGALFDACGRWDYDKTVYRSFNKSCTTPALIKEQTGIDIFLSKYEIENFIR